MLTLLVAYNGESEKRTSDIRSPLVYLAEDEEKIPLHFEEDPNNISLYVCRQAWSVLREIFVYTCASKWTRRSFNSYSMLDNLNVHTYKRFLRYLGCSMKFLRRYEKIWRTSTMTATSPYHRREPIRWQVMNPHLTMSGVTGPRPFPQNVEELRQQLRWEKFILKFFYCFIKKAFSSCPQFIFSSIGYHNLFIPDDSASNVLQLLPNNKLFGETKTKTKTPSPEKCTSPLTTME